MQQNVNNAKSHMDFIMNACFVKVISHFAFPAPNWVIVKLALSAMVLIMVIIHGVNFALGLIAYNAQKIFLYAQNVNLDMGLWLKSAIPSNVFNVQCSIVITALRIIKFVTVVK